MRVERLETERTLVNAQVNDLMNTIYDMHCVALHNVPLKQSETPKDFEGRLKKILAGLGFQHETENIADIKRVGHVTVVVRFHNPRAAQAVISKSDYFTPQYWHDKRNGAAVIQELASLRALCIRICNGKKPKVSAHRQAYIHVTRWKRDRLPGPTSDRPAAAAAASASSALGWA